MYSAFELPSSGYAVSPELTLAKGTNPSAGFYRKHDLRAFCRHTAVSEYNAVAVACGNGENIAVGAYGQRIRQIKRAASGGDGASVRRVAVRRVAVSRVRISVYAEFG